MRFLPLIFIFLLFDMYVFEGVKVLMQGTAPGVQYSLTIIYWLIPALGAGLLMAAASGALSKWPAKWVVFARSIFFIIYLSKFILSGVLLTDDLRRLVMAGYDQLLGTPQEAYGRSAIWLQFGALLSGIPLVSLIYGMIRNPYRYKVHRHKLPLADLPAELEGLRIVQISDIHTGSFPQTEPVRKAVELINKENPDLVLFTGDLVNNAAYEAEPFVEVFKDIRARHGVFSVLGNHDYGDYVAWPSKEAKQANLQQLADIHRRLGWDLLLNEHRQLPVNGRKVAVIGVENYSAHPRFPKYGNLAAAYTGAEAADVKLLLSHDPSHWEAQVLPQFQDIDITFSGHTHGMQFGLEIPGLLKWSPIQYVYKEWAGLYQKGRQWLYVNRGLGFLGYPGRVGILPEITVITLQKA